jgi:hypothetical protein
MDTGEGRQKPFVSPLGFLEKKKKNVPDINTKKLKLF